MEGESGGVKGGEGPHGRGGFKRVERAEDGVSWWLYRGPKKSHVYFTLVVFCNLSNCKFVCIIT